MGKQAPRLKSSDEERTDPVLKKRVRRAQKATAKADWAYGKTLKETVKIRERVILPQSVVPN